MIPVYTPTRKIGIIRFKTCQFSNNAEALLPHSSTAKSHNSSALADKRKLFKLFFYFGPGSEEDY